MEKSESRSRFNFIDVIIILTLLVIIAAIIYMTVIKNDTTKENVHSVVYTVKLTRVDEACLPFITKGAVVVDISSETEIGTVAYVNSSNSVYYSNTVMTDTTGIKTIVSSEYDNLYDVYVTLSSQASVDERGIAYIGKNRVLVGAPFNFRIDGFASKAFCTEFKIK